MKSWNVFWGQIFQDNWEKPCTKWKTQTTVQETVKIHSQSHQFIQYQLENEEERDQHGPHKNHVKIRLLYRLNPQLRLCATVCPWRLSTTWRWNWIFTALHKDARKGTEVKETVAECGNENGEPQGGSGGRILTKGEEISGDIRGAEEGKGGETWQRRKWLNTETWKDMEDMLTFCGPAMH